MRRTLFILVLVLVMANPIWCEGNLSNNVKVEKGKNDGEYVVAMSPDKDGKVSLGDLEKRLKSSDIAGKIGRRGSSVNENQDGKEIGEKEFPVYKEKNEKSGILTKLSSNKSMVFMSREGDWVKVATESGIGYMKSVDLVAMLGLSSDVDKKKDEKDVKDSEKSGDNDSGDVKDKGGKGRMPVARGDDSSSSDEGNLESGSEESGDREVSDSEGDEGKNRGIPAKVTYDKPVHVRGEKRLHSEEMVVVKPGTMVNLLSVEDDWCKIEFDGKTGYVRAYYLGLRD
jgi:SH3-like domain-containing protein